MKKVPCASSPHPLLFLSWLKLKKYLNNPSKAYLISELPNFLSLVMPFFYFTFQTKFIPW